MYCCRRRSDSIFDAFTLSPLPYPVLLILAVTLLFLAIPSFFSYEETVEATEAQMSWALLIIPVALLFIVRWSSCMESPDMFFVKSPWGKCRQTHCWPAEGCFPWGVAAFIVLLLVLVQFQSSFAKVGWYDFFFLFEGV